jgi:uncharacterized protein YdaU (DUF1376 family)
MSKSNVWMPLYVGDYLADTMHLGAEEHGAYLLLLMHYWRTGPLVDNDRVLAGIARVDRKVWAAKVGETVRAFFHAEEGRLHHSRVDMELARAQRVSSARAEAGKRGAASKHGKSEVNGKQTTGYNMAIVTDLPQLGHVQSESHKEVRRKRVGLTASRVAEASGTPANAPPATSPAQAELVTATVHPIGHDPVEAMRLWNVVASAQGLPTVMRLSQGRRRKTLARLRECGGIEGWRVAVEKLVNSPFLCGDNDRGWAADFDFLLQPSSFAKLMEGSYDRTRKPKVAESTATDERAALRAHLIAQGVSYG